MASSIFNGGNAWNAYKRLENDFLLVIENVALDHQHDAVYSQRLAQLMLITGGFVDTTFQQMLHYEGLGVGQGIEEVRKKAKNDKVGMNDYRSVFEDYYGLSSLEVNVHKDNYGRICPFDSFKTAGSPDWWKDYTDVKHDAFSNMKKATIGSCLRALGGLFLLNVFHMEGREALVGLGVIKSGSKLPGGDVVGGLAKGYLRGVLCKSPRVMKRDYGVMPEGIWAQTELFQFYYPVDATA
jgi:hypothetical protein